MEEKRKYERKPYRMGKGKGKPLDLIGERFGRLIVTKRAEDEIDAKSGKHKTRWYCDCDCGEKDVVVRGTALTSGQTRSCGCLHREISKLNLSGHKEYKRKHNTFDLSGEYGIGYTTKGEEYYFDLEDYNKIKDYCWYKSTRGYLNAHIIGSNKKQIKMHNLVMPHSDSEIVDHINRIPYDNRKENLRITTQEKNVLNREMSRNNTTGKTGVFKNKQNKIKIWTAYIRYQGKQHMLGSYENFEDAVKAREEAEIKYFGEYRRMENEECN